MALGASLLSTAAAAAGPGSLQRDVASGTSARATPQCPRGRAAACAPRDDAVPLPDVNDEKLAAANDGCVRFVQILLD